MTEPTTPDAQQTAPEATAAQPEQQIDSLPQWARDAISKANREAASYRTQVAELKPKAEQFTRLEEASKSEAQRLAEAASQARSDAEQARAEAVRYRVAATHGITADHFDLLGSGTEDEIVARAAKLSTLLAAQAAAQTTPATAPSTRPVEQMRPGALPGEAVTEDDAVWASLFGPPTR